MSLPTLLRRYGTLIGFAIIIAVFWVNLPDTFMTAKNWLNITQQLSMLMVVAAGMTIVMVMGDFDLSVGSAASLAGIVAAMAFVAGYPVWMAVGLALLVGAIDTRLSARDPGPDPDPDSGPGSAAPVESTGPDRAGRAVPR